MVLDMLSLFNCKPFSRFHVRFSELPGYLVFSCLTLFHIVFFFTLSRLLSP